MGRRVTFAAACTAMVAVLGMPASAQDIGVVASLDPNLTGTPPGSNSRTLTLGNRVFANEEIVSTSNGRGQLLFVDETTLSIAPNSRVILDSFIYDPAAREGSFSLRLTKGALRFIGGQTTRTREAQIQTPTSTIGIRGSSVLVSYENGTTTAVFLMGDRMCMQTDGARSCTSRRGAVLGENGYQGVIDPDRLGQILTRIDGLAADRLTRSARRSPTAASESVSPDGDPISTHGTRRDVEALDTEGQMASGLGLYPEISESGFVFAVRGPNGERIRSDDADAVLSGCPAQGLGGSGSGTGKAKGKGAGCGIGSDRGSGRAR